MELIIFGSILIIFALCFLMIIQEQCPSEYILIKYSAKSRKFISQTESGKRTYIIPFLQDFILVPSGLNSIIIKLSEVKTKDPKVINITFISTYEFAMRPDNIKQLMENVEFYYTNDVFAKIRDLITSEIEAIIGNSYMYEIENENFIGKVNNVLTKNLRHYGIELRQNIISEIKF